MNENAGFDLGDHFASFIEAQIAQGGYESAADVVRAALRLLDEQEVKLAALRAPLVEGEPSGQSTPFDFDAFVARKRDSETRIRF
ncbi:MAG: type II toxin-antitoxin system ParD family antitoxin [Methylocella sp.]|nr:MAG: type II toxin-antitoxin system ParD family antitoxin [Hyphomicrobiales bacterium]